jgi:hypothetical protein
MGFMDKEKRSEKRAAGEEAMAQAAAAAQDAVARCPLPGTHYVTEVNKGSINMTMWALKLNEMYSRGYRLAHTFEQDGNTVQVFEHHFH